MRKRAVEPREAAVWVSPRRVGGMPCIYGTRLTTEIVAALAWRGGFTSVLATYDQLTEEQILVACWYEVTRGDRRSWRRRIPDWPSEWRESEWRVRPCETWKTA